MTTMKMMMMKHKFDFVVVGNRHFLTLQGEKFETLIKETQLPKEYVVGRFACCDNFKIFMSRLTTTCPKLKRFNKLFIERIEEEYEKLEQKLSYLFEEEEEKISMQHNINTFHQEQSEEFFIDELLKDILEDEKDNF